MTDASNLTQSQLTIPADLRTVLSDVRADGSPTDWCLAGFEGDSLTLKVVGSGSGGVSELRKLLRADSMFYGLVRTTEQIDKSSTVKVRCVPCAARPSKRKGCASR
eukprot:6938736-Prymnesium_polylepis.1